MGNSKNIIVNELHSIFSENISADNIPETLDKLLQHAYQSNASDIHISPEREEIKI